ncbi:ThuA domain-containing protein [Microbacterium sp. bgisy207]|uniref:ThuA domain-containing protein n=1 Tax=Microbacterium sp. bgisy207 TaxID=3413800 RepID=UPI003EC156E2
MVWNEGWHEVHGGATNLADYYPGGIHGAITAGVQKLMPDAVVRTAALADPEHGLTDEVLDDVDVLLWWGHRQHADVDDAIVERVHQRVLAGMGLLVLHSGHHSKIFKRLMGTTCNLQWRNAAERELVWTVAPNHPISEGVPNPIVIPQQEMYGEQFDIPVPDELVFISSFAGGEVFRSGVTYTRGRGRIFYFSPGDQDYPVYNHPDVQRVLVNAIRWAHPAQHTVRELPAGSKREPGWFAS